MRGGDGGAGVAGPAYRVAAGGVFRAMDLLRWRVTSTGLEHVPRSGGAILVANHLSYVDYFTVGRPPYEVLGRPMRLLGKASLFRVPVVGSLMRASGHIPVERGVGASALAAAVDALGAGELVGVLPEQTISPSLDLLPFKTGAVRMSQLTGAPLVPAVSWGTQRALPVGGPYRPAPGLRVLVAYGPPRVVGADADPVVETEALRCEMAAMLEVLQRSHPDGLPAGARWVPARLGGGAPTAEESEAELERLRGRWSRRAGRRSEDVGGRGRHERPGS